MFTYLFFNLHCGLKMENLCYKYFVYSIILDLTCEKHDLWLPKISTFFLILPTDIQGQNFFLTQVRPPKYNRITFPRYSTGSCAVALFQYHEITCLTLENYYSDSWIPPPSIYQIYPHNNDIILTVCLKFENVIFFHISMLKISFSQPFPTQLYCKYEIVQNEILILRNNS